MKRGIFYAAAMAAVVAFAVPAQARMFDPALNEATSATVQNVQYWHHHHHRWWGWHHHRHWDCWWWHGRRHCDWNW